MSDTPDMPVVPIARLALAFAPRPWDFATARRDEIASHFAALRRDKPAMWNGRVLLMHRHAIEAAVFSGAYLETDFASFMAWRDWGFPDPAMRNCFAMGALRAADGAFLLGVMGDHTANAGKAYFPAGTPEPADVVDGQVDLAGSIVRELAEETGLGADDVTPATGWHAVLAGPRIALMRIVQSAEPAARLRQRILGYLRDEAEPELSDIRIVRGPQDLDAAVPPFVTAYLTELWRGRA